jgi:tetratricopeptide (TPR) repeat protein
LKFKNKHILYYNISCAYSKLKDAKESKKHLIKAIIAGYTAIYYIKSDPDLSYLRTKVNIDKIINTVGILNLRISYSYALKVRKNLFQKNEAEKHLKIAKSLYIMKKYKEALGENLSALKFYATGAYYINTGDILYSLKRYTEATKAFLTAAKLGGETTAIAYYKAAYSLPLFFQGIGEGLPGSSYKYLELAVKNGFDYTKIRRDARFSSFCYKYVFRSDRSYNEIINSKIFKYCYSKNPNFKVNLKGRWVYSYLHPPAAHPYPRLTFKKNNIVIYEWAAIYPNPRWINYKYGTYKLYKGKLYISYTKKVDRICDYEGRVSVRTNIINEKEMFKVIAKRKNVIFVFYEAQGYHERQYNAFIKEKYSLFY